LLPEPRLIASLAHYVQGFATATTSANLSKQVHDDPALVVGQAPA